MQQIRDWNKRRSVGPGPKVFASDQLIATWASPPVQSILEELFGPLWSILLVQYTSVNLFSKPLFNWLLSIFCPVNSVHALYPRLTSQYGRACWLWKQKLFSCKFNILQAPPTKKKKENMLKEKRYDYHTSGQASEEVYSRMEERI